MMVGGWASVGWEGRRNRGRGEASASEWSGAVNSLCVQGGGLTLRGRGQARRSFKKPLPASPQTLPASLMTSREAMPFNPNLGFPVTSGD